MPNNNYDFEAQKILINDNSNVTETNPLKDLFKIATQLFLIVIIIYFSVFILSGIFIKTMPTDKQIKLENTISKLSTLKTENISNEEKSRLEYIKKKILSKDKKFPKTSKLEINITPDERMNAFCYPNGNIYITSGLYKKLKNEDELAFVIAHEMAHYKNRDHLMALRKNISAAAVMLVMSVVSPNDNAASKVVSSGIDASDLSYSRGVEKKADNYAKKALLSLYGNTSGGVKALEILDKEAIIHFDLISTHPDTRKRIENLKK